MHKNENKINVVYLRLLLSRYEWIDCRVQGTSRRPRREESQGLCPPNAKACNYLRPVII